MMQPYCRYNYLMQLPKSNSADLNRDERNDTETREEPEGGGEDIETAPKYQDQHRHAEKEGIQKAQEFQNRESSLSSSPAQETAAWLSRRDSMHSYEGEMVDCELTPMDMQYQRQNLKDAFNKNGETTLAVPPPLEVSTQKLFSWIGTLFQEKEEESMA